MMTWFLLMMSNQVDSLAEARVKKEGLLISQCCLLLRERFPPASEDIKINFTTDGARTSIPAGDCMVQ